MGEYPLDARVSEYIIQTTQERGEQENQVATRFSANNPEEVIEAAWRISRQGAKAVVAFNGIYGIMADGDNEEASSGIYPIKKREREKRLVMVSDPEFVHEHVDFSKIPYSQQQIIALQTDLHALGIILPANETAPQHLVTSTTEEKTILSIWTNYEPLKQLVAAFRFFGGRALAATSANKSGEGTHWKTEEAWADFKDSVDVFIEDDFSTCEERRKQSTSVVQFVGDQTVLCRLGNTSPEEIQEVLSKHRFGDLFIPENVARVIPRTPSTH